MSLYIVRIRDLYCEWSCVCDAPASMLMPLDQFRAYYFDAHPHATEHGLAERMQRVHAHGLSAMTGETVQGLIACNRAGERETYITEDEIIERYANAGN